MNAAIDYPRRPRSARWCSPARVFALGLILCVWLTVPQAEAETRQDQPVRVADASKRTAKPKTAKKKTAKRKTAKRKKKRARKRSKKRTKRKICKRVRGKRRCRWVPLFEGHGVARGQLRTTPVERPSGDIHLYAVNFGEELTINIYDAAGQLDEGSLAKLDHTLRCRRTGDERAVDPRLYQVLSVIYEHFGKRRIELISGFRNQTNEKSRHYHASAMDIRVPGVPTRELAEFAASLDTGNMGVGRYPRSDFVHIDFRAPGEKSYRWTDYSSSD